MKVVIVGGVAAGMSCAARLRRLDEHADIVVFERDEHVSFANCGLPYHIGEVIEDREALLLQTPATLRDSLDLDVRTGTEVIAIDPQAREVTVRVLATGALEQHPYDELVLTPGAAPVVPPLPGIDHPRVHVLRRIDDMDRIKARIDGTGADAGAPIAHAVVIGGGYIGLEMAENLHHRGVEVVLVELAPQIMPPLDPELTTELERHLVEQGVELHLGTAAAGFSDVDGRVEVELATGARVVTDLVVLAAGVRPTTALAQAAGVELGPRGGIRVDERLRTSVPGIWAAGDAVEVRHEVLPGSWVIPLAGPANRQGRVVADNLAGRDVAFPTVLGTGIVQVFEMTAGGVGANRRQLTAAGIDHHRVHLHPGDHAGYYPGASALHLELLFAPGDGRVLGAGVVGRGGVDKRLDVLATAIRAGMTVFDLEQLELAYAPPFSSAKDPVNMAGFLAANLLRGDLRLWYADDYPAAVDGARIVDVRSPEEHAAWHLRGADNVPLATLRQACEGWDRDQPLRLYCAVGFRSYLAYRLLVQRGFTDVATLSGGSATFRTTKGLPPEAGVDSQHPVVSYAEERTGALRDDSQLRTSSAASGGATR